MAEDYEAVEEDDDLTIHIRVAADNWNAKQPMAKAIANLINQTYPEYRVYIIDVEEP